MKFAYTIIVMLHGIIHVMGFLKGFGIKEIKELTMPISKPMALVWLLAVLLTILYAMLLLLKHPYAWGGGLLAVVVSQVLVFMYWQDARFGTLPNMLILVVCIFQCGQFHFNNKVKREKLQLLQQNGPVEKEVVTEADLQGLPLPVKTWLQHCGMVGKPYIRSGSVVQEAQMKMKPDQEKWIEATALQYTTTATPGFIWNVDAKMNPLLGFYGRDLFQNGKGQMLIKLNGLIHVVNESGKQLDEGTAQRYLGELVWFPSLALSPYISWETIDSTSAKATILYKGTAASGTFEFNDQGEFVRFSTMRYMENTPDAERFEWVLEVQGYHEFEGIRIPSEMTATWKLQESDWTWLRLKLIEVTYNQ